jgi:hypothetical protein
VSARSSRRPRPRWQRSAAAGSLILGTAALAGALLVRRDVPGREPAPPPAAPTECGAPQRAWIFCDDFERDRLDRYFEYDPAGGRFVRAPGVGLDGSYGMRARYDTVPQRSAGSLKLAFGRTPDRYFRPVDAGRARHREIYWRLFLRLPPGWQGGGGDKLARAHVLARADWSQAAAAHVWSGYEGEAARHLVLDPASGVGEGGELVAAGYNDTDHFRWLGQARSGTAVFAPERIGRWQCIEARVRLEDRGEGNGVFELWVDGALEARREGLRWVGPVDEYGVNALFIENYWNEGAPVVQERYLDRLVVSTERIGC